MKRYFIVFFYDAKEKVNLVTDVITEGKFPNRDTIISQIPYELSADGNYVEITNIKELPESDYYDWIFSEE